MAGMATQSSRQVGRVQHILQPTGQVLVIYLPPTFSVLIVIILVEMFSTSTCYFRLVWGGESLTQYIFADYLDLYIYLAKTNLLPGG